MAEREEWRPVLGREGEYEVSSLGRVRSHYRGGRLLAVHRNVSETGRDYDRVRLGRHAPCYVHILVCEAWHGPRPGEHPTEGPYYACHRNGDRHDNTPGNLYWGSASQNVKDAQAHGTYRPPGRRRCRATADLFAGSGGAVARG